MVIEVVMDTSSREPSLANHAATQRLKHVSAPREISVDSAIPMARELVPRDIAHNVVLCSMGAPDTSLRGLTLFGTSDRSRIVIIDTDTVMPLSRNGVCVTHIPGDHYYVAAVCIDSIARSWKVSLDLSYCKPCCSISVMSTSVCLTVNSKWLAVACGPWMAVAHIASAYTYSTSVRPEKDHAKSFVCSMGHPDPKMAYVARFECMQVLSIEFDYIDRDILYIVDVHRVFKVYVKSAGYAAPIPVIGMDEQSKLLAKEYVNCIEARDIINPEYHAKHLQTIARKLADHSYMIVLPEHVVSQEGNQGDPATSSGTSESDEPWAHCLDWRGTIGTPDMTVAWTTTHVHIIGKARNSWTRTLCDLGEVIDCSICGDAVIVLSRVCTGILIGSFDIDSGSTNVTDLSAYDTRPTHLQHATMRKYICGNTLYGNTIVFTGSSILTLRS